MERPRIVIIGAGPAGIRCAQTLVDAGLSPIVLDEQPQSGGQIYKRQPPGFKRDYNTLYGTEALKAKTLHRCADMLQAKIDYYPNTSVWDVQDKVVYAYQDERPVEIHYDYLVLCTGAIDRVIPIAGWQQAGSYTLGGAQIALKHQGLSIGKQVVFMGTGPLLYLVAYQYVKAGANVEAVLDTSSFADRLKGLLGLLAKPKALLSGVYFIAKMKKRGVVFKNAIKPKTILGDEQGVAGVEVEDVAGKVWHFACDAVATGFHLKPETQLADLLGCEFIYEPLSQLWLPKTDDCGRTTVAGVYCAGDGSAILGADAAECAGKLAAMALLTDAKQLTEKLKQRLPKLQHKMIQLRRFGMGLQKAFPWPAYLLDEIDDNTVICRCEMIVAKEIRDSVVQKGADEVNRSKSFTRVGMGRCQGRYCSHVNAQLIANASRNGRSLEATSTGALLGRQRSQAPVKPLPVNVYLNEPLVVDKKEEVIL